MDYAQYCNLSDDDDCTDVDNGGNADEHAYGDNDDDCAVHTDGEYDGDDNNDNDDDDNDDDDDNEDDDDGEDD